MSKIMTNISKYDAFSTMNFFKKTALVEFLCAVNEIPASKRERVVQSIDYALKETISFGGFIVSLEKEDKFIGAVIVNKSGMGGFLPDNLVVLSGVAPVAAQEEIIALLLKEADMYTMGNIAIVSQTEQTNEVQLLSLKDSQVKYLNDSTLRERVLRAIA